MNLIVSPAATRLSAEKARLRAQNVTAVLGPTNTGKTHYAIERMLAHSSGLIGLPLRLLAREVYQRVVEKVGPDAVALITGEEKIKPKGARYWVCTLEAMPRELDVAFVAIDEIQLAANLDRGHVFTDRLLNRRGREETLVIGASTMTGLVQQLLPGAHIVTRPRLSTLTFAGEKKISRLPRRTAIVAFSAEEVYAIAEWIRRQRGGAAVVLGALSPRTRNAQVEMYQNGDVDYIVATDAIGMGLNLDVDHIAFAGDRKFDGWHYRRLHPAEFGQIAGRAGRYMRDGTFGTTGRCGAFDEALINDLEEHRFDPVAMLQWRNTALDFASLERLQASLDVLPDEPGLSRAPIAIDQLVLEAAARDADVRRIAATPADIARLWDVCQIPDYRKLSPAAHSELALSVYNFVVRAGKIPDDWFAKHVNALDRTDGDIDALSARIAHVRTWTFIANRADWLKNPEHWQGETRRVEDSLSDALHERLAQRFVDRRTSVLMRRLRENAMLEAEITATGDVLVESQHVGSLHGFRFTPDPLANGEAARALNAAALKALASEIDGRATRVNEAVDEAFVLANDGVIRWLGEAVGKISAGEHILKPRVNVLADEQLTGPALELVQKRLDLWLGQHVTKLLGALNDLENNAALEGAARGVAFQVAEALGVLERGKVAEQIKALDQDGRGALRKLGVRFGAYHLFMPLLLKPAPRALAAQLWALKNAGAAVLKGVEDVPHLASSGRTSFPADKDVAKGFYRAAGFRVCGERAVRVDILERLADLIRPAIAYRPGVTPGDPPAGAADGDGFVVTVPMTSLAGCSGENFAGILRSLGYAMETRPGPAITTPLLPAAKREPIRPPATQSDIAAEHPQPAAGEEQTQAPDAAPPEVANEPQPALDAEHSPDAAATAPKLAAAATAPAEMPDAAPAPEPEAPAPAAMDFDPLAVADVVTDGHYAAPPAPEATIARPADGAAETPADPDAHAVQADIAPQTGPAVAVEPVMIEVWRQQRQGQHGHHRQERGGERQRAPKPAPRIFTITPRPPRPERAPAPVAEGAEGASAEARPPRPDRPRPPAKPQFSTVPDPELIEKARAARPQGDDRAPRRDNDRGPRPDGAKRFDGPRPRPGAAFASTETPKGRDKEPDPDSPFAKLAALKAQLEGRGKKD